MSKEKQDAGNKAEVPEKSGMSLERVVISLIFGGFLAYQMYKTDNYRDMYHNEVMRRSQVERALIEVSNESGRAYGTIYNLAEVEKIISTNLPELSFEDPKESYKKIKAMTQDYVMSIGVKENH